MTLVAFERGDWQAVVDAHQLESHDPQEWLRYGAALLHTIEPGPQQGRQQQQAALAFEQAKREGASEVELKASQRQVVRLALQAAVTAAAAAECA
jgi:hypothetical protein